MKLENPEGGERLSKKRQKTATVYLFGPEECERAPLEERHAHISAPSRQALLDHLELSPAGWVVHACCGRVYRHTRATGVPEETLPCACGDPNCIIVEYRKQVSKEREARG